MPVSTLAAAVNLLPQNQPLLRGARRTEFVKLKDTARRALDRAIVPDHRRGSEEAETCRGDGRGDRIRTCDILLPKQARYQTAPLPDADFPLGAEGVGAQAACSGAASNGGTRQERRTSSPGIVPKHPGHPRSRSSFSTTASRTQSDRSRSPRAASTRASSDGAQRIGFISVFSPSPPSGFRPIGGAVAAKISCANSYIPACPVSYIRYITSIHYGGKNDRA